MQSECSIHNRLPPGGPLEGRVGQVRLQTRQGPFDRNKLCNRNPSQNQQQTWSSAVQTGGWLPHMQAVQHGAYRLAGMAPAAISYSAAAELAPAALEALRQRHAWDLQLYEYATPGQQHT